MRVRFCFIFSLVACLTSTAPAQVYELIDLGMQGAYAINDSGVVVGYGWGSSYLWDNGATSGFQALHPGGYTVALGINNAKQVVGYADPPGGVGTHAVLWNDNVVTDLGAIGGRYARATCINDSGEVAGEVADSTGIYHPFFWKNGVVTVVATPGDQGSGAAGINILGQVTGASRLNDTTVHAYRWQNGSVSDLGTLAAGTYSLGYGINNLGQVAGSASVEGPSGGRGFLWSGGGMTDVGVIEDPGTFIPYSSAFGVNDASEVVGSSTWAQNPTSAGEHAFVWRNGVMTDLNAVSDTAGGWILTTAAGINNKGDIVSSASYHGMPRGVLLKKADIYLTRPRAGDLWVTNEREAIRWLAPKGKLLNIEYTQDERASSPAWIPIAQNVPSDSGHYEWKLPDGVNTQFGAIRIMDASDPTKKGRSGRFRLRTMEMVRLNPDSTYTRFQFGKDSWSFANVGGVMWPPAWYSQFFYQGGFAVDPVLIKPYPWESPFDSAKASDFPDWPLFARTFGENFAYQSRLGLDRDYNQIATAKWKAIKGSWGGSCSGMSLTAILGFDDRARLVGKYPSFPAAADPFTVPISDSLRLIINELFQHWHGKQHQIYVHQRWPVSARQTIADLKDALLDESNDHRYLYISWLDTDGETAAHAIVPYKLERDTLSPGWYIVHIYDVSYPGSLFEKVLIDSVGDRAYAPTWTAAPLLNTLLMDRASTYLDLPAPQKAMPGTAPPATTPAGYPDLELWPVPNAYVRIEKPGGGVLEYTHDSLVDSVFWGSYLIPPTTVPSAPALYMLQDTVYRITLKGFRDQHAGFSLFDYFSCYGYERSDADSTQTDVLSFSQSLALTNPDTVPKNIAIESIADLGGGTMKYRLSGLTIDQGDSVSIKSKDGVGVLFANSGGAKTADLVARRASYYKGSATFRHAAVPIPAAAKLWLTPGNDSLSTIKMRIDIGQDGSYDDSMMVSNDLTGVDDGGAGGLPSGFALYQNYPNPFNPRTTLRYDLPTAARVTLRVYDLFGRRVATLVDRLEEAGTHSAEWNAADVASGVYVGVLEAGDVRLTKKLVLIR